MKKNWFKTGFRTAVHEVVSIGLFGFSFMPFSYSGVYYQSTVLKKQKREGRKEGGDRKNTFSCKPLNFVPSSLTLKVLRKESEKK